MSDGVLKDIQNMLETPSMRQGGLPTISSVPCTRKCSTLLWVGKSLETCRISQMFSALSSRTSAFIDGPKEQKLIMPWLTNTCGWHFAWNVPFLLERNPGFKSGTKLHPIKKTGCALFLDEPCLTRLQSRQSCHLPKILSSINMIDGLWSLKHATAGNWWHNYSIYHLYIYNYVYIYIYYIIAAILDTFPAYLLNIQRLRMQTRQVLCVPKMAWPFLRTEMHGARPWNDAEYWNEHWMSSYYRWNEMI